MRQWVVPWSHPLHARVGRQWGCLEQLLASGHVRAGGWGEEQSLQQCCLQGLQVRRRRRVLITPGAALDQGLGFLADAQDKEGLTQRDEDCLLVQQGAVPAGGRATTERREREEGSQGLSARGTHRHGVCC